MPELNKEWKLPKNVKQIGDTGGDKKIYVEDYVITFLEEIAAKGGQKKALLFGEIRQQGIYPYIFADGAMEVENFSPDNAARDDVKAQIEKYFAGKRVVGWFFSAADSTIGMPQELAEIFQREFAGENSILIVRDAEERETYLYRMEAEHLLRQPGYYIYYEKNTAMQEYMISQKGGKSVEQEQPVKDDAIKRFRKIIREKKHTQKQTLPSMGRLAYLTGGFLAVTVLALGVTMVYNYDKMKDVERSLARLTNNVDSQSQYLEDDADTAQVMLHIDEEPELEEGRAEEETEPAQAAEPTAFQSAENTEAAQTEGTEAEQTLNSAADLAETESEVPAAAVARASYTVKMGDTLAGISQMYYGNMEKVAEICSLNGIADENTILPGQKILLP